MLSKVCGQGSHFSCYVWEGKEESLKRHVILNLSWHFLARTSTPHQMNSRLLELLVSRCRTTSYVMATIITKLDVQIQWGLVKPWSVGSRDQNSLISPLISPCLRTILPIYPYYCPCRISDTSNFSKVYLPRLH